MANHEVLLLKPVDGLGAEGDQVKVRAGYARNYLLPQGMAVPLTVANRKQVEALKKARGLREAKELDGAQALAKQIEKAGIAIAVKTGEAASFSAPSPSRTSTRSWPRPASPSRRRAYISASRSRPSASTR